MLERGLAGGNVALLYASRFNDVSKVVNISGRFNLERGIEGRLGKDFLQRIKQNGFIDVINKRGKQSNVIDYSNSYIIYIVCFCHLIACSVLLYLHFSNVVWKLLLLLPWFSN